MATPEHVVSSCLPTANAHQSRVPIRLHGADSSNPSRILQTPKSKVSKHSVAGNWQGIACDRCRYQVYIGTFREFVKETTIATHGINHKLSHSLTLSVQPSKHPPFRWLQKKICDSPKHLWMPKPKSMNIETGCR